MNRVWRHLGFTPKSLDARSAIIFLVNFAVAKFVIYLLPLAIAVLAPPEVYGGFELALSIGLLVATIVVGPPMSGLNQAYLVKGERRIADQAWLVLFAGCCLALLLAIPAAVLVRNPTVFLVAASLGVAVIQTVGAQVFRTIARRNLTAWADGASVILAGAVAGAVMLLFQRPTIVELGWGYFIVASIGAIGAGLMLARTREPELGARLREATRIGLPMTLAGIFAFWLSVGGRIVVGVANQRALPVYGVAFRLAGLALGIHQLISTAIFARLYAARTREADRLFAFFLFVVGLFSAVLVIMAALLPLHVWISAIDAASPAEFRLVLALAALTTFYWIGFSLLQLRVNRAGLAGRALNSTILVTSAGAAAAFLVAWLTNGNLIAISLAVALHGAVYFFTYSYLLAKRGLPHRLTTMIGAAGGAALALIAMALA